MFIEEGFYKKFKGQKQSANLLHNLLQHLEAVTVNTY